MRKTLIVAVAWIFQVLAMFSDIALIVASIILIAFMFTTPFNPLLIIALSFIIIAAYRTWKDQGGFIAWTHRKQFMENWKKFNDRIGD